MDYLSLCYLLPVFVWIVLIILEVLIALGRVWRGIEVTKFLCVMMAVYFTVLLYSCRCLIGYRICRVVDKKDNYMRKFSASMSVVIVMGLVMNAIAMYISR